MVLRRLFYGFCLFFWAGSVTAGSAVVTMKSGERLLGELDKRSDKTTLVLKSALLGELSLPREQILMIEETEAKQQAVASKAPQAAPGNAENNLKLTDKEIAHIQERRLIEQVRDFKAPESWSGNLRLGINFSQGDSQWTETYAKGSLIIDPESSRNYYRLSGSYTYRETERNGENVKSTDRYDANFTYRRDLSDIWFLQNSLGGRVDQIKGIDHELQELVGLGLRVKPTEQMEFIIGGGGGAETFDAGVEDTRDGLNPVANFFQEFTWRPFEKAKLAQEFTYFVNPEEPGQFNYVMTAAFRYRLTDLLGLEFSFNQNFDNDVGDGNTRDDTRWRNAIIVYF